MRAWRKIESSILTSDRLSRVSDSAKWLFTLLLVAQDDEGKYPQTKPRMQALTSTTLWDSQETLRLLSELSESGIVELSEGFIKLRNGAEKNGTPTNAKGYIDLYPPIAASGTLRVSQESLRESQETLALEKSRVEIEIEKIPPSQKKVVHREKAKVDIVLLTEEHIQKFVELHGAYWSPSEVRQRIEEALAHVASKKNHNQYLYVRGWLRRDAPKGVSVNGTTSRNNGQGVGQSPESRAGLKRASDRGKRYVPEGFRMERDGTLVPLSKT